MAWGYLRGRTVESLATAGGGTEGSTLNVLWSTICAAAGTFCAKAWPMTAPAVRNALVEGMVAHTRTHAHTESVLNNDGAGTGWNAIGHNRRYVSVY